jgi:hypothetical protein
MIAANPFVLLLVVAAGAVLLGKVTVKGRELGMPDAGQRRTK